MLASEALDNCRAMEDRLNGFFIAKIGRESAEGVMALLQEKSRSGLDADGLQHVPAEFDRLYVAQDP
jgi:hypothetical protein